MTRRLLITAGLCFVMLFSTNAMGALAIFTGKDTGLPRIASPALSNAAYQAFEANLISWSTEDFESLADFTDGDTVPITTTIGVTLDGSGTIRNDPSINGTDFGMYPTSGSQFVNRVYEVTMTFDTPQAALGFYLTDAADAAGALSLTLLDGSSAPVIPIPTDPSNGSVLFFGVITSDNPIVSATINNSSGGGINDLFGLDDLIIATPNQVLPPGSIIVPEPHAALVWTLLGACALIIGRKRRER